jgi:hypothetical protein
MPAGRPAGESRKSCSIQRQYDVLQGAVQTVENIHEEYEVKYWTTELGITREHLRELV